MKLSAILLGAALLTVPVAAEAASPREFLDMAQKDSNAEIMLGQMARDRGFNPGVRDYGRTLVNDHTQARTDVLRVGRRYGIRADRDTSWQARQLQMQLQGLRGRDFDRVFINAMIDDHRKAVDAFQDEARQRDGAVSRLARDQLPTLQKHLDIALDLDRQTDRPAYGARDRDRDWDRDNRSGYSFRNR